MKDDVAEHHHCPLLSSRNLILLVQQPHHIQGNTWIWFRMKIWLVYTYSASRTLEIVLDGIDPVQALITTYIHVMFLLFSRCWGGFREFANWNMKICFPWLVLHWWEYMSSHSNWHVNIKLEICFITQIWNILILDQAHLYVQAQTH